MFLSLSYLILALGFVHIIGLFCVFHAILNTRSSQGAIAWCSSLLLLPYLAVPLYLVFGRSRFKGYRELKAKFINLESTEGQKLQDRFLEHSSDHEREKNHSNIRSWENIFKRPFLGSNEVQLLVDGVETFDAIEDELLRAKNYILFQFFIIREDELAKRLFKIMSDKVKEGVRVYVIYDEIGSSSLSSRFVSQLRNEGIKITEFDSTRGLLNKLQFNFRNHRKVVVIDGKVSFVGGHNVGIEYLGKDPRFGNWHDYHIRVIGPETAALQLSFLRDWYWAKRESIEVVWDSSAGNGNVKLLTIATGPSDILENCSMMFLNAINNAKTRFWVASPYFVPDDAILLALQTAAARGVDVRVLLPKNPDHTLVWLASFAYVPLLLASGAKVYRYSAGFLHCKAFVSDNFISMVGTANLDTRSLRLNFEIGTIIYDQAFNEILSKVFESDFTKSVEEDLNAAANWPLYKRVMAQVARLFGPII